MGLTIAGLKWFRWIQGQYGVNFNDTAMLGRQFLYYPGIEKLSTELKNLYKIEDIIQDDGYSEKLFYSLGAKRCISFDASDYENANVIWDFNENISDDYVKKFSVVLDAGTMEHIFDYPTAIRNAMKMVCYDGHLLLQTPTNNWCGHGFYQFSPDLFISLFQPDNGFIIQNILLVEILSNGNYKFRNILNENYSQNRYDIKTNYKSDLYIVAKRIGEIPDELSIQQGFYVDKWKKQESSNSKHIQPEFYSKSKRIKIFLKRYKILRIANSILKKTVIKNNDTKNVIDDVFDIDYELEKMIGKECI